jgi:uncharacterized repeat protein (TIGR01451 family)
MIIQNQIWVFLMTFFLCLGGGITYGQCPNNYVINTENQPTCGNVSNGRLLVVGNTYYSGSTYIWSNGSASRSLYNVPAGHYTVTITDPTTCTYTATTYLATAGVDVSFYPFNTCTGQLRANVHWSTAYPRTYLWGNGSTQNYIQNPAPGHHSVTITDGNGCTGEASIVMNPYNTPMTLTHTSTVASCNANDASIDLTVTGGTAPYAYSWSGVGQGQTVEDPVNLARGYTLGAVRDANNCISYYPVNVDGVGISLQKQNTSCGQNNGSLTVNTTNLSNPTFLWSTGATTPVINNLAPWVWYSVTVTDGTCVISDSARVSNGGNIYLYLSDSSSNGCDTDYIQSYVYGGAGAYNYLWSTGETTPDIMLQQGINQYSVTVTDLNGCAVTSTIQASLSITGLNFSSLVTDATCGNSDGAIDLTMTLGTASSFLWSPTGDTTEDITGLAAGFHTVAITNSVGCTYYDTIPVGEFIELTSINASCGLNNGSATVYDYGMTSPTFAWSNGVTTPTANNLTAGTYYITVTNGACALVDTLEILDGGLVTAQIISASNCAPSYLAAVTTAGAAPYTYLWNNGATSNVITSVTQGDTYYVTITDANGCFDSTSFLIPVFPAITATEVVTDAVCNGENGSIYLTMTGGTAPYNFSWSYEGVTAQNLIGLFPGQYTVNISDNNGCVLSIPDIVVGGQTIVNVNGVKTNVNAANTGGAIDITVTGVTSPTFLWSNGATTEDITNLSSGWYSVTITDLVTGCTFSRNYTLAGPHVTNPNIKIRGHIYDVSATGTCQVGLPLAYEMVTLQPLGLVRFTNVDGAYEFNITTPGNYTVEYVNTSPLTTTVLCPVGGIATINGAVQGVCYSNNFYLTNPPAQDLEIDLYDYSLAAPGFSYYTRINYCNKGNTIMNGTIEYDYNALLGFESITGLGSTLTLHDIPGHKFNWSFNNLNPAECRWVDVKFRVPANTPLGTALQGTADILPIVGDVTPADNTDGDSTTVVGAWDPNDKQVGPYHSGDAWNGGIIYTTDEELEYTIRFQNTGTAPAHIVVIRDTLDMNLLPETVRDIQTKHDADISLENGNILVFTFNNIYLPDSSADFDASMGFVKFKVNRIAGLPVGTQIENTAAIYFDYNVPIITNTPISVIDQYTSVVDVDGNEFTVETMPNPFERGITLKYTLDESSEVTIRVMNSIGQCVYTHVAGVTQNEGVYIEQLNMEDLPSGMYLLNVETNKAMTTTKIVKR